MAQQPGNKTIIKVGINGTTYAAVCLRSTDLEEMVDLEDVTNFCTTGADYEATLAASRRKAAQLSDTSITLTGLYDGSTEMLTTLKQGTSVYLLIGIDTGGGETIDEVIANVPMIVASRSRGFNVEGENTFSVSLQGNGPVKLTATY